MLTKTFWINNYTLKKANDFLFTAGLTVKGHRIFKELKAFEFISYSVKQVEVPKMAWVCRKKKLELFKLTGIFVLPIC